MPISKDSMFKFQAWECVSFVTIRGTTLDFVIADPNSMMALLSLLCRQIYKLEDKEWLDMMRIYLNLKVKMKLGFQAMKTSKGIDQVIIKAIQKTVAERMNIARSDLQKFIKREDGMPHNLLSESASDSVSNLETDKEYVLGLGEGKRRGGDSDLLKEVTAKCILKLERGLQMERLIGYIATKTSLHLN